MRGAAGEHKVNVMVSTMASTDSRDDGKVNLRVEDAISGECLVDVDIPAGRWWRLLTGLHSTFDGAMISPNLDRVGKEMTTSRTDVPDRVLEGVYRGEDKTTLARRWVEGLIADGDRAVPRHDSYEIRHTNQGTKVIWRRWEMPGE